jgi:hypothetical protein
MPEKVQCLDMMGREIAARPLRLSPSPVYLVGPAGKARELLDLLEVKP